MGNWLRVRVGQGNHTCSMADALEIQEDTDDMVVSEEELATLTWYKG